MPKFLLDENVPPAIGVFRQSLDFDVVHAKDSGMLGASDNQIMDLARQEERTLTTFSPIPSHHGEGERRRRTFLNQQH